MRAKRENDVAVSGGGLAVFSLGASGPAVLAVHGITSSSHTWLAVERALAGRARLLAPDLRGRGRSNELPPPYGLDAHVQDMLATLDAFELEDAVLVGHSLGAWILAELAALHPERARAVVLADGGLGGTGPSSVEDPQQALEQVLGPTLARLDLRFENREAYREWWRRHPAFAGSDVEDADLAAYADHDLIGEPPELFSAVAREPVRADAADLLGGGDAAERLSVPAIHLSAPRGLVNDANPLQPLSLARAWAERAPEQRRALHVPDVNHYTLVLGAAGSRVVADQIAACAGS